MHSAYNMYSINIVSRLNSNLIILELLLKNHLFYNFIHSRGMPEAKLINFEEEWSASITSLKLLAGTRNCRKSKAKHSHHSTSESLQSTVVSGILKNYICSLN